MFLPYTFASEFGVFDAMAKVHEYVMLCMDNDIAVPIEIYESLFYLLPNDVCEKFDWDFNLFYDFLMRLGDYNEP